MPREAKRFSDEVGVQPGRHAIRAIPAKCGKFKIAIRNPERLLQTCFPDCST